MSNRTISICFLSHSAGNAGAEKSFPELLKGLNDHGININVLLPAHGVIEEELKKQNLNYEIVGYSRWLNAKSGLLKRLLRSIKNLIMVIPVIFKIRKWKSDIVYSNTSTIFSGALAAWILRKPHIWHFREFGFEDYGYQYDIGKSLTHYFLNKLSTICLVNSIAVKNKYTAFIPDKKVILVYEAYEINFNDTYCDFQLDKTFFNLVIVGTLHKAKGHKDAILALKQLILKGEKVKLHIVGDGLKEYKDELQTIINSNNLSNSIIFHGYLDNPIPIISNCDLLLMCSVNEAFGLVTLEAMKSGVPVIGSKSGGTMELIKENFNGLFYTHGDSEELSAKISYLLQNKDKLIEMKTNASKWANETFIPEQYIQDTLKIIHDVKKDLT